jgi:hypothetical protein
MMQNQKKIDEILREAAAAVVEADIPEDLRSVAFGKAVELISGCLVTEETPVKAGPCPADNDTEAISIQNGDQLGMISQKLEADMDIIENAFEIENGVPQLTIPRSRIASSKRAATKQIALLVAAARQAAGVEQQTESKTIRECVDEYGKYDKPNFARAISELEDDVRFNGKGQSRTIKMRRDGFKSAGELVKQLLGRGEA